MPDDFKFDVFLSHSSKDKAVVRAVAERLRNDGLKVWFDEWMLKAGDSIPAKIEEALEHSRLLVLCMSANAFGSDWSQLESYTFRFRDPLNKERRFIPLRLDDSPIKGSLAQFLYINWRPPDREREYGKLVELCRLKSKQRSSPTHSIRKQDAQVIAVHLHPEFQLEIGGLVERWNSAQSRLVFNPVCPPQNLESLLLSMSPVEVETVVRIASQIREVADFKKHDGIFQFCEGRLFDTGYYQLFSWTTWLKGDRFDSSTISLFIKRKLASQKVPLFALMLQSMLYALGAACGLTHHNVTRTCVMDFNNRMPDMLLGLAHGPKFCPHCEKRVRDLGNEHLLGLATGSKTFLRELFK